MAAPSSASLWAAVVALGAFHGANPSMGWLFAVSNGMFARQERAVFAALPPIALGHLLAMAAVLLPIAVLSALAVHTAIVREATGAGIIAFGVYRLVVRRHPRLLARIGPGHLTLWSFVMATAHGAALMLVPIYFGMAMLPAAGGDSSGWSHMSGGHAAEMTTLAHLGNGIFAAAIVAVIHTAAMLVVAGAIAWIFFRYVGIALLRRVWFNVDIVWSAALIGAGVFAII
jgi:hypothetical protein